MALHSCFHMLLGVANVAFIHFETCHLIYHNQVVALVLIWHACLFLQLQGTFWMSFEMTVAVEFCVEVTLEKLK
jgi:hypothetical protein